MIRKMDEGINSQLAKEELQALYESIENSKLDFRNANLYQLLLSYCHKNTLLDIGTGVGHIFSISHKLWFHSYGNNLSRLLNEK